MFEDLIDDVLRACRNGHTPDDAVALAFSHMRGTVQTRLPKSIRAEKQRAAQRQQHYNRLYPTMRACLAALRDGPATTLGLCDRLGKPRSFHSHLAQSLDGLARRGLVDCQVGFWGLTEKAR